jgi:hypothetical protein
LEIAQGKPGVANPTCAVAAIDGDLGKEAAGKAALFIQKVSGWQLF